MPLSFGGLSPRVEFVSRRAVLVGLTIFAMLLSGTVFVKMSSKGTTKKKLDEFEFTVDEPDMEEFELEEPMRDILQEVPEELQEDIEIEERPDIHITVEQVDVEVTEEVVQMRNIEIDTPEIEVDAVEIDIDAPEEISEVSEVVDFAVTPIAVTTMARAEIFQYDKPTPRNKPAMHVINRAPRPNRAMKVMPKAFGDQDAPSMGELGPANINLFGTGDFFRTMTRTGGLNARSAVDSALNWLARHQEPGGMWDPSKWEGNGHEVGNSGLALLAFMGGGHTMRTGDYRRNVLRGIEALIGKQEEKTGAVSRNMYEHSIATIALCEAYGRAKNERVGIAARKAVEYLQKAQNRDGGWRYSANSGTSDMSVASWGLQALKTAKLAQIRFDNSSYSRAMVYVETMTHNGGGPNSNGQVGYEYSPEQNYSGKQALTCAGMVLRQFTGTGIKSPILIRAAESTKKHAPSWDSKDFYEWYYATYAMHNMGGEYRIWWNRRIRDVLLEHQARDGDNAGSWDPEGARWASHGGRVYTTAIGALCLEVYYRYSEALNSFGVAPDIDDLFLK